jgi:hypothetical protein
LLICDFWHLSVAEIIEYKESLDKLNMDYIIMAREYHLIYNDNITNYHIKSEYKEKYKSEYYITDKINNWTSSLESLSISYIRDKKLDNLLGN